MIKDTSDMSVREMLQLSQTDVTSNPLEGYSYAATAYTLAVSPEATANDPTAAGEAAAKAAFRLAQLPGDHTHKMTQWFEKSYTSLEGDDNGKPRERIATDLLSGRAWGLISLRSAEETNRILHRTEEAIAVNAFNKARQAVLSQHLSRTSWDPYATMLSRHYATYESVRTDGRANFAVELATQGIWQAIRSRRENANTPDINPAVGLVKHAKFIGKQAVMNGLALGLAASKLFDELPKVKSIRRQVAKKLLG